MEMPIIDLSAAEPSTERSTHGDRASEILDGMSSLHNSPYDWRIQAAHVHALLELAAAIRTLKA